jgi:nitrite reductase (NADH) small subunit
VSHHRVCAVEELAPCGSRPLELDGRRIVLVRAGDGSYHALADLCPHQGARLSGGCVGGAVVSERPGSRALVRPGEVIRCPWHNFAFDVRSGRSLLEPDRYRVRVYPVVIADGAVLIEVRA